MSELVASAADLRLLADDHRVQLDRAQVWSSCDMEQAGGHEAEVLDDGDHVQPGWPS